MHSAIKIANLIIHFATRQSVRGMTQLKLMKLTYIAHGWMLGIFDKPLFSEDVEAWLYGPVIPELHRVTTKFEKQEITEPLIDPPIKLGSVEDKVIERTIQQYGVYSGPQLVTLTHRKGTPWYDVTEGGEYYGRGLIIPNEAIRDYYGKLVKKVKDE